MSGFELTLPMVLSAGQTIISTVGAIQKGKAQQAADNAQAASMQHQAAIARRNAEAKRIQAGQEVASSQRAAIGERKQGRAVASRAVALAAASGGGATDPTTIDVISSIDQEGDYRALTALYQGSEAARALNYGASISEAEAIGHQYAAEASRRAGKSAKKQSMLKAFGTILGGAKSIYDLHDPAPRPDLYSGYAYPGQ